jgi:hypothetical protein
MGGDCGARVGGAVRDDYGSSRNLSANFTFSSPVNGLRDIIMELSLRDTSERANLAKARDAKLRV